MLKRISRKILSQQGKEHVATAARQMNRYDYFFLIIITFLYACLVFFRLGSFTSPQTSYTFATSVTKVESVTFDLGAFQTDFRMLYMGGIHYNDNVFSVQTSVDGSIWSEPIYCNMTTEDLFQWQYVTGSQAVDPRSFSGRYVRLSATNVGLTLFETLFRDGLGHPLSVSATSSMGSNISALIDEPDTLQGEPGWYNSMYFDEIYFARTGYEYLHGLAPYETSHPPLGKVLMALSISIFGMTPFGWRFAGALAGVLMLPGIYLLAKLLFKKTRYAVLASLLLSLDSMHYTQTRIATIDSFAVLFIIWSVYFMIYWLYMDLFTQKLWKTLLPLACSGIFMGLSVASKWTGCFAGLGLAILYLFGIGRKILSLRQIKHADAFQGCNRKNTVLYHGALRLLLSTASCLFFFVLIPAIIYYCSYIPHFSSSGGVTVQRIIDAAKQMFTYHSVSGLGTEHFFYSPWYEWPLSIRPMLYSIDQYTSPGYTSSISAMGNYAIWWGGFAAVLVTIFCTLAQIATVCSRKRQFSPAWGHILHDERHMLLTICFAAQFLPWVLVPRSTFIYHYFPSIPFLILCICNVLNTAENVCLLNIHSGVSRKIINSLFPSIIIVYILIALLMFILFLPVAGGFTVSREWLKALNWFHTIYY